MHAEEFVLVSRALLQEQLSSSLALPSLDISAHSQRHLKSNFNKNSMHSATAWTASGTPLPRRLRDWLGPQAGKLVKGQRLDLLEVYCGSSSQLTTLVEQNGGIALRIGLDSGHDLLDRKQRRLLEETMEHLKPRHSHVAFPCKGLGAWNKINAASKRSASARQTAHDERLRGLQHLRVFDTLVRLADRLLLGISGENPVQSDAWVLSQAAHRMPYSRLDQCMYGLRHPDGIRFHMKPTYFCSNRPQVLTFLTRTCCGQTRRHVHALLEGTWKGKRLTSMAEHYPRSLAESLRRGIMAGMQ